MAQKSFILLLVLVLAAAFVASFYGSNIGYATRSVSRSSPQTAVAPAIPIAPTVACDPLQFVPRGTLGTVGTTQYSVWHSIMNDRYIVYEGFTNVAPQTHVGVYDLGPDLKISGDDRGELILSSYAPIPADVFDTIAPSYNTVVDTNGNTVFIRYDILRPMSWCTQHTSSKLILHLVGSDGLIGTSDDQQSTVQSHSIPITPCGVPPPGYHTTIQYPSIQGDLVYWQEAVGRGRFQTPYYNGYYCFISRTGQTGGCGQNDVKYPIFTQRENVEGILAKQTSSTFPYYSFVWYQASGQLNTPPREIHIKDHTGVEQTLYSDNAQKTLYSHFSNPYYIYSDNTNVNAQFYLGTSTNPGIVLPLPITLDWGWKRAYLLEGNNEQLIVGTKTITLPTGTRKMSLELIKHTNGRFTTPYTLYNHNFVHYNGFYADVLPQNIINFLLLDSNTNAPYAYNFLLLRCQL